MIILSNKLTTIPPETHFIFIIIYNFCLNGIFFYIETCQETIFNARIYYVIFIII